MEYCSAGGGRASRPAGTETPRRRRGFAGVGQTCGSRAAVPGADRPVNRRSLLWAAMCIVLALTAVSLATKPITRHVHTGALLNQLEAAYRQSLNNGAPPATSAEAFVALTDGWNIDWNSCRRQDGALIDGWGNKVQITFQPESVDLRAAGPDREYQTPDDLTVSIITTATNDRSGSPAGGK